MSKKTTETKSENKKSKVVKSVDDLEKEKVKEETSTEDSDTNAESNKTEDSDSNGKSEEEENPEPENTNTNSAEENKTMNGDKTKETKEHFWTSKEFWKEVGKDSGLVAAGAAVATVLTLILKK